MKKNLATDYYDEVEIMEILEVISTYTQAESVKRMVTNHQFLKKDGVLKNYAIMMKLLDFDGQLPILFIPEDYPSYFKNINIHNYYLKIEELLNIYFVEKQNFEVATVLEKCDLLSDFPISLNQDFITEIERRIDVKKGEMKWDASKRLKELYKKLTELKNSIRGRLEGLLKQYDKLGYLQDNFYTLRDERFVIPINSNFKHKIKGIIHSISATGQTTFIEPMEIVYNNNALRETEEEINFEIIKILKALTEKLRLKKDTYLNNIIYQERLEYFLTMIRFLRKYNYSIPTIGDHLKIIRGRHPLLEWQGKVIPFDLDQRNYNLLLITGPNTGGKTITLKTIAIIAILTKMGIPIPTEWGTIVPYFDKIFIDIGDRQNISSSLSTFSAHLMKIKETLDNFDKNDIALFDEPGTGTEPALSDAFAMSLIDILLKKGGFSVFTTHSYALKDYTKKKENTEMAAMVFDTENLIPTYQIHYGISGDSYAIEIAERLNLDRHYIDLVKSKIGNDYSDYKKSKEEADKLVLECIKKESQLKELIANNEQTKNELSKKLRHAAKNNRREFERKYNELRSELERLKKDIAPLKKEKKEKFLKIINNNEEAIKKLKPDAVTAIDKRSFKIGDFVKLTNSSDYYKIIELEKDSIKVEMGEFSLGIDPDMVEDIREKKKNGDIDSNVSYKIKGRTHIDVRGKIVDEALLEIEQVINEGFVIGAKEISILHGKGTGRLRESIREYLKNHPLVDGFNDSSDGKNVNAGVTIVKLKN